MAASSIFAFWAVAVLLILVPGADWAFTISAGLRGHSVLPAVSGLMLGYAAMTVVVAAGLGTLVARTPDMLTALTIAGGIYLMWLGARTLVRPSAPGISAGAAEADVVPAVPPAGVPADPPAGVPADPPAGVAAVIPAGGPASTGRGLLARGVGVSGLNPKGLLLFLALLPQFTNPRWSWPLAVQLGFLGLIFMISCGTVYLCVGSVARKALRSRPAAAHAVTRISGAAMLVIGALLLAERLAG
jgi:threonine/homoserine/homoserine lactone efflux protein